MLIVAENINSTRKPIRAAIEAQDTAFLQDLAKQLTTAQSDFIDVNAGAVVGRDLELLPWLVDIVQAVTDTPLCIDTPNPAVAAAALERVSGNTVMINSISLERERYAAFIPLVQRYNAHVIAMVQDDGGMPETVAERMKVTHALAKQLAADGVPPAHIHFDYLTQTISSDPARGPVMLEHIRRIREELPEHRTIGGLSNVSFGLPVRKVLNRAWTVLCLGAGIQGAIANPLDRELMALILGAETLLNRDEMCMNYIHAHRQGLLE